MTRTDTPVRPGLRVRLASVIVGPSASPARLALGAALVGAAGVLATFV